MLERRFPDVPQDGVAGPPGQDHDLGDLNSERRKPPGSRHPERMTAEHFRAGLRLDPNAVELEVGLEDMDDVDLPSWLGVYCWKERKPRRLLLTKAPAKQR